MNRKLKNKILSGVMTTFLLTPITVFALGQRGPIGVDPDKANRHELHARWINMAKDERAGWAETGWAGIKHSTTVFFGRSNNEDTREGKNYTRTRDIQGIGKVISYYTKLRQ